MCGLITYSRWNRIQLSRRLWRQELRSFKDNSTCVYFCSYHRLRGSASPVLTATGFVNGKGQFFDPPQNRHPSTDHQKICHRWLRRRPLRLCQIRCISVHGGLLGTWVKYNKIIFIYAPFFKELTYRSDTSTDFHAWWLKRRGLAQGCAFFWEFFTLLPI